MSRAILAVLALVACGPPDFGLIVQCHAETMSSGYASVRTVEPEPYLCSNIDESLNLSRAILEKSGFTHAPVLNETRGRLTFGVLAVDTWDQGNVHIGGVTYSSEIVVGHEMWSTLHEEIHAIRLFSGVPEADEAAHKGWNDAETPFITLTDFYVFEWLGLRVCNGQSPLTVEWLNGLRAGGFNVDEWLNTPCAHE